MPTGVADPKNCPKNEAPVSPAVVAPVGAPSDLDSDRLSAPERPPRSVSALSPGGGGGGGTAAPSLPLDPPPPILS